MTPAGTCNRIITQRRFATEDVHVVAPHSTAPHRVSLPISLSAALMSRDTSGALGVSLPRLPQPRPRAFIRGAPRIDPSERRLRPVQRGTLLPTAGKERESESERGSDRKSGGPGAAHRDTMRRLWVLLVVAALLAGELARFLFIY